MKKLSLLILIVCNLSQLTFAQENEPANESNRGSRSPQTDSSPPSPSPPSPRATGESVSTAGTLAQSQRRRTSGRQLSPLKPLRTVSGSMPGFMQRAAARNSARQSSATTSSNQLAGSRRSNAGNSNAGSSNVGNSTAGNSTGGNQQRLQQTFLNNAMLFDENSDQQLAANELRNLFILLVSENIQNTQNTQYNYYGNGFGFGSGSRILGGVQYHQPRRNQGRSTGNLNFVNQSNAAQLPEIGFLVSDAIPGIQSSSMQEAILLFLLLTLQFDIDGDGALNRTEIQRFATALLNNELNLNQAAVQAQRPR